MGHALEELRPNNPAMNVDNYVIEFNLLSLKLINKFTKIYGSISKALTLIEKEPSKIYEMSYLLISDKEKFPTQATFKLFLDSSSFTTDSIASELLRCFYESVIASLPVVKNQKLKEEYQKALGHEAKEPCYGEYYDTVAKRYSYTIDDFMNLTLRQLHIILTVSSDGIYEEFEVQAALLGKQLKPRMKMVDIDEATDKEQDEMALQMLKEQQAKYNAGKK